MPSSPPRADMIAQRVDAILLQVDGIIRLATDERRRQWDKDKKAVKRQISELTEDVRDFKRQHRTLYRQATQS